MRRFSNLQYRYDYEKNSKLLAERGIGFDEVVVAMLEGNLLAITNHYNIEKYTNQKIAYVLILDIVYVVPFVEESENSIFLKTAFPSRKATKIHLSKRS